MPQAMGPAAPTLMPVQYKPDVGGAGDASGDGASGADPHASAV